MIGALRSGALLAGVLIAVGPLTAAPSWAAPSTEVVEGRYIRIVSVADWQAAADLRSGDTIDWDLTISADAPEPGSVTLGVSAAGGTPLIIDATLCSEEWGAGGCPGEMRSLRSGWDIPLDGSLTVLAEQADTDVARLRLSVSLGSNGPGRAAPTNVLVHAQGLGETTVVSSDPTLSATGASSAQLSTLLVASGLLLLGLVAQLRGRRSHHDGGAE